MSSLTLDPMPSTDPAPERWRWDARSLRLNLGSRVSQGVRLDDPGLAPVHACLVRVGAEVELHVLNCRRNTWLEGQLVLERARLRLPARLTLGQQEFVLSRGALPDELWLERVSTPDSPGAPPLGLTQIAWTPDLPQRPAPQSPPWTLDELSFFEAPAREPEALARYPWRARLDPEARRSLAMSASLHLLAIALLMIMPPPTLDALQDADELEQHVVTLQLIHDASPAPRPLREDRLGDGQDHELGQRARGPEGAAGSPQAPAASALARPSKRTSPARLTAPTPSLAPEIKPVHQAGALALLRQRDALAADPDALDALAHLRRPDEPLASDTLGQLSLGLSGLGRGGAGQRERGLGLASLPTDQARGLGGQGLGQLPERGELTSELLVQAARSPRGAQAQGHHDPSCPSPATVARVIQARHAQLRACYEDALRRQPSLRGELVLQLEISPEGHLSRAQISQDTLRSAPVARCVQAQLSTLRWPRSPRCAQVRARYPLRFWPQAT